MSTLEELCSLQTQVMNTITRALTNYKKLGQAKMTPAVTRQRLTSLKETFQQCLELHGKISLLANEKTQASYAYFKDNHFILGEDHYNEAADFMAEMLDKRQPAVPIP